MNETPNQSAKRPVLIDGPISKKSDGDKTLPTQDRLGLPLPHSNGVTYQSMSLIDDSAQLLFGLMKDAAEPEKYEDGSDRVSLDGVNSAVECAKQIQSLMRLKLDVIKEFKKGNS